MNGLAALSDPTRQRIVEMLAGGALSSGEIASRFKLSPPAVSQHLAVLRGAGLVITVELWSRQMRHREGDRPVSRRCQLSEPEGGFRP